MSTRYPAARVGDICLQQSPHCHAPIHPPAPVPTPVAHPAIPLALASGVPTVLIGGRPAATVGSTSTPCMLPGCVPAGPGVVVHGATRVLIGGSPAARVGDLERDERRADRYLIDPLCRLPDGIEGDLPGDCRVQ